MRERSLETSAAGRERGPLGGRRPREVRGLGREELGVPLQQDGQVRSGRAVRRHDATEFRDAGLVLIPRDIQIEAQRVEEDVLHRVYTFGGDRPLARQDVAPRRRLCGIIRAPRAIDATLSPWPRRLDLTQVLVDFHTDRREVHVAQRSVVVVLLGDHDAAQ